MLSLLKKKPEAAAAAAVQPYWHPNFRNVERLPDTKVVRTSFFVNTVAIVAALVALLWFSYQAYNLHDLSRQIAEWQQQIDHDKRGSDQAIALYKKFQDASARADEIAAFGKTRPVISELLLKLGQTLPDNVAIDLFDLRDTGLTLRATVRGAPDQATGYASAYVDTLRNDPLFKARFDDISLINLNRVPQTGRQTAEILLKLKGVAKEGKKP
jgi:hypothetical protein